VVSTTPSRTNVSGTRTSTTTTTTATTSTTQDDSVFLGTPRAY
jgi:hypothetical protein